MGDKRVKQYRRGFKSFEIMMDEVLERHETIPYEEIIGNKKSGGLDRQQAFDGLHKNKYNGRNK